MDLQAGGLAAAIQDPAWALRILEAWFGTEREFIIAADELLKGVTEREEARTTKQIATQLHSLMGVSGRHVILSAMDASLINSGMSNRQPLFISCGHLEYADVEPYMKTTLGMVYIGEIHGDRWGVGELFGRYFLSLFISIDNYVLQSAAPTRPSP